MICMLLIFYGIACKNKAHLFDVDEYRIGVKHRSIRGTIFKQSYPFNRFFVNDVDSTFRWTPTAEDIELAEKILCQQIAELNADRVNQVDNCPTIHKHLSKYFRQYVGITNDNGQRVIHVNFYWSRYSLWDKWRGINDDRLRFWDDYEVVFDGCSYYWQVNINLDNMILSDLSINGIS
ncbi:hypothetical protein SAMN05421740_11478 [Parapedobacter koreensis]|uniref:Uncharacterized protein n=2 Tax=Parapedobacter koreensis TaxID=332977 RepID=A0A1H7UC18_9SPHI|nr:hypothetical protein SAMN05421740_11478 [Parapedobacter koreensis]